jgi:DNA polymerase-3 subunit gamma/tau
VTSGSASPRGAPAPTSAMQSAQVRMSSAPRSGAEASARPQAAAAPEPQSAPALRITSFPQLVALAGEKRDLLIKAALEADMRLVRIEDGKLEIALEPHAARSLVTDLSRKLEQWSGRRWTVVVSNEAGQPTIRSQNLAEKSQRERAAEADPRVREVLARFPGAKVIEVRRLAAEPPESEDISDDPAEIPDNDD